jgi:SHS2 domain-containing protein
MDVSAMNQTYHVFDHTADLGIEIYGRDEKELFSNAVFALFDIMTDIHAVYTTVEKDISIEGADREDLMINFLREILYLFNGEGFSIRDFLVFEVDSHRIRGTVRGEFFDPDRHCLHREIKAVTYHQTEVNRVSDGWRARVIFDV